MFVSSRREKPERTPLSREAITDAALAIVDAEGLEALSMRRLALDLGTGPASLYAHVSGKPELLRLLIDRVAGEVVPPEPDPARWQEQLKEYARVMRAALARHSDLAGAMLASVPTGPNVMRSMDGLLGILRAGGLPDRVVAFSADLLALIVSIDVYEGSLADQRVARDPDHFAALGRYMASLPADRFPHISALVPAMLSGDEGPDDRFEFALDVIVGGIAALGER